jgi:hypothetical protein
MARRIRINVAVGTLVWLSLLSPVFLGCGQRKSEFKPLANGFGYVIIRGGIDQAPGAELHYRGTDGKDTLIWDNVASHVIISNDMAVFAGERLVGPSRREPKGYLETRLFAVRAPGPTIDITAPVFWIGLGRSLISSEGESPDNAFLEVERNEDGIVAVYTLNNPRSPDLHAKLSWGEVSNLLSSAGQATGK